MTYKTWTPEFGKQPKFKIGQTVYMVFEKLGIYSLHIDRILTEGNEIAYGDDIQKCAPLEKNLFATYYDALCFLYGGTFEVFSQKNIRYSLQSLDNTVSLFYGEKRLASISLGSKNFTLSTKRHKEKIAEFLGRYNFDNTASAGFNSPPATTEGV